MFVELSASDDIVDDDEEDDDRRLDTDDFRLMTSLPPIPLLVRESLLARLISTSLKIERLFLLEELAPLLLL